MTILWAQGHLFFFFFIKLTDDQGLGFDWISRSSQVNLQCIVRINDLGAPLSGLAVTFLDAEVLRDQIKLPPYTVHENGNSMPASDLVVTLQCNSS